MVRLVVVKNPFQPRENRIVTDVEYGLTLRQIIDLNDFNGTEIYCTVNGNTIEYADDYVVPDNEIVVISPVVGKGGKSILGIVAMIGLTIATGAIANGAFIGMGSGFAAGGIGAYTMAAATMFVGSMLINRYLSPKVDTGSYSSDNDQTYSWNGVQTMEGQNNPITMTYGKVLSGGQTIGKFIDFENDKEYLNWLISAGEGELNITDIKFNDNPIENYENVQLEIRNGTNDQTIIPFFSDTYSSKPENRSLDDDKEKIVAVQGNATEKIIVKLNFPRGLYYAKDNGELGQTWINVQGWFREKGATDWTFMFSDKISDSKSSAVKREYSTIRLSPAQYEIKVQVTGREYSATNSRSANSCEIYSVTSVVYDDFTYPNIALIGIRAMATDQLNGTPSLSFIKERANVWVYNPHSQSYEQKPANNPAWACYDMLHLASRLKNVNTGQYEFEYRGASKDVLIYDQFNEWATFCDENHSNLKVNIEITQAGELLDIINKNIANCGRGMVVRFGTKYGCIWDSVKQPVQMFGMGNIISGTFKEEFLPINERANCVEITYTDEDMNFNRNTITIYADNYDESVEEKTAQVTYNGITSYEQAYREGKYHLYCNKYLLRTVTFDANVDAIACTIGDCIMVSHDVPKWAKSGRIYDVDMDNKTLVLPIELGEVSGDYRLMYRTVNDNLYTVNVNIVSHDENFCYVQSATPFNASDPPQKNDVFDLALRNIGSKPFVIKTISRSSEMTRTISAIEYNENVYTENYDIPPINYTVDTDVVANVDNLVARQTKTISPDGDYQYKLEINWDYDDNASFIVFGSYDGENYTLLANGINEHSYSFISLARILNCKVVTRKGVQLSSGVSVNVELIDKIIIPQCTNIRAFNKYREMNDDIVRYDIEVTWTPPANDVYKQAQVWYKTNSVQANNIGVIPSGVKLNELGFNEEWKFAGIGINTVVIPQAIVGDSYKIAVCTQDIYGNAETPDASPKINIVVAMKTETPNTPDNLSVTVTDAFNIEWSDVRNADIKYYEVRTNTNVGTENGLIQKTASPLCKTNNVYDRNGTIYVYAIGATDKISAPAIVNYNFPAPYPPAINVKERLQGINLSVNNIPVNVIGVHWFIDGMSIEEIRTTNNSYVYSAGAGVYNVSACYYDYFGDGNLSGSQMVTITATIPPELIADESIMLKKLSADAQKAIEEGGLDTVNIAVKGLLGEGSALVLQPDGSYALVASNGETLTGMFANNNGIITLQGKYVHITGDTKIDGNVITDNMLAGGISANKINATSLSAISATVGHIRTASSGARIEIGRNTGKPNLFEVIDANGVVRVRLGEW